MSVHVHMHLQRLCVTDMIIRVAKRRFRKVLQESKSLSPTMLRSTNLPPPRFYGDHVRSSCSLLELFPWRHSISGRSRRGGTQVT